MDALTTELPWLAWASFFACLVCLLFSMACAMVKRRTEQIVFLIAAAGLVVVSIVATLGAGAHS